LSLTPDNPETPEKRDPLRRVAPREGAQAGGGSVLRKIFAPVLFLLKLPLKALYCLYYPFRKGSIIRPIILAVVLLVGVPLTILEVMGSRKVYTDSGDLLVSPPLPEKRPSLSTVEEGSKALEKKLAALAPKGLYIVVDTAANRLYLHESEKLVREAIVSCGSGNVLSDPRGDKTWLFDTPRGEYVIQTKITNPVWNKPDWAFVEEGKVPPPKNSPDRAESGVMGDYAMGIGKGYFLHGTMYTRMLGRNVTHGCVRIGDEDLKVLYETVPKGTKVYIY
jgi:L,D-transpeptidase YbiS